MDYNNLPILCKYCLSIGHLIQESNATQNQKEQPSDGSQPQAMLKKNQQGNRKSRASNMEQ